MLMKISFILVRNLHVRVTKRQCHILHWTVDRTIWHRPVTVKFYVLGLHVCVWNKSVRVHGLHFTKIFTTMKTTNVLLDIPTYVELWTLWKHKRNCFGVFLHTELMIFIHILGSGKLGCSNLAEGGIERKRLATPEFRAEPLNFVLTCNQWYFLIWTFAA